MVAWAASPQTAEVRPLQPTNQPPHSHWDEPEPIDDIGGFSAADDQPRGPWRRRIVRGSLLIVLFGLVSLAGVTAWGIRQFDQITKVSVAGVTAVDSDGPTNWLLVGTDSRDGINQDDPNAGAFLGETVVGNRTDTMMILRVDREAGTADLISIPRDLWVPIAGAGREGRVNGAFNGEGGRDRLVATLSDSLGVEINQYVEVNFVGFRRLVDVLGGVPVWFEHPARDTESGLGIAEAGCHVLDGTQGLAFARARTFEEMIDGSWQLEPTGDLGRTARQRLFLAEFMAAAGDRSTIGKVGLLDDVLGVVGENLVLGDTASTRDLIGISRTLSSIGADQIMSHALPVEDFRTSGGAQVLRLKEAEAVAVLDQFRTGDVPAAPSLSSGQDGLVEPTQEEQPSEVAQQVPPGDAGGAGYGVFGFTAATSPAGTPCE